jgi:hypothetical protein
MFTRTTWHVIDRAYADDFAYLAKLSDGDLRAINLSDDKRHAVVYFERGSAPRPLRAL